MLQPHDAEIIDYHPIHWSPTLKLGVVWNVLGGVLTVLGILGFAAVAAVSNIDPFRPLTDSSHHLATLLTLLILAVLLGLHEVCHGAVMRQFGAQPTYGAGIVARVMPVFYCASTGFTFTRDQYALAAITPVTVISVLGASLIAVAPFGAWLVVPLGLHLGGAVGDIWATVLMLRQPRGTLIEDTSGGIIIHRPVRATAQLTS